MLNDLLTKRRPVIEEAGREAMRFYDVPEATWKEDGSPVTAADTAAEKVILPVLRQLTPDIPVISEEEAAAGVSPEVRGGIFWLVDPLDGTKEFIKRNGEFTVNIALIEDGKPTLGIVLAPVPETLWRGDAQLGADMSEKDGGFTAISTRDAPSGGLIACASRSHSIYNDLDIWFRNNDLTVTERIQAGSSLKFCLIAEGKADIYPRFGPTNEWDTAAGQGVLEAAGGQVEEAAHRIGAGELVALPTETVYGLGADATNERAVAKIFEAKGRP